VYYLSLALNLLSFAAEQTCHSRSRALTGVDRQRSSDQFGAIPHGVQTHPARATRGDAKSATIISNAQLDALDCLFQHDDYALSSAMPGSIAYCFLGDAEEVCVNNIICQ
jgi:hypothetical protein